MLAGIKFNQLGFGDPLINKNWSYKGLWGINAAQQKLVDQFSLANEGGFQIIYDSIRPTINSSGKLTLDNSGYNSAIWPVYNEESHHDRISLYKSEITQNRFKFICQVEFPKPINSSNMEEYAEFLTGLIKNPDFNWIENWQISDTPEELIVDQKTGNLVPKVSPIDYVTFLNKVRTAAKLVNSGINIGGPGIFKALGILNPNNYLHGDTTFYHAWLSEAIKYGLLSNIDFFSVQLKYDTKGLDYDNISPLSMILKELINNNLETSIPIYSINQGRPELNNNSEELLQDQTYYNVTEFLTTTKNGIIPIFNCIADLPSDPILFPEYNSDYDGYGLCSFDLSKKPQYETFKFVLNQLKEFTMLTIPNKIYNNELADSISFINNNKEDIISIVWSKYKTPNTIVILPNTDQYYTLLDGIRHKIVNPYEFDTTQDLIVITQHLNLKLLDYDDIKLTVFKKYMYNLNFRNGLLKSLPKNYNTSTDGTNFYKILRASSLELADSQIQVDILNDNSYLDTAHNNTIHQNFGTLVNLEKQSDWDYEKYRRLVKGVIKSLLNGPTLNSIEEAVNLFINYESIFGEDNKIADIKIHELYSDRTLDPLIYDKIYPQFAFLVEVDKNIDVQVDQDLLNRDLKYIVNILKPAHTLSFIVVILTGSEDYKKWYYENHFGKDGLPIEFKDSDEMTADASIKNDEGLYGWKHMNYFGSFHTFNPTNKCANAKTNGGILIGPRHTIYDVSDNNIYLEKSENVNVIKNTNDEDANVLRYGYYVDDQDSLDDPGIDNPVPLLDRLGNPNPDYNNPDSGEYYKNWWLKYHKLEYDITNTTNLNGNNINYNKNVKIVLEKDTTKFNTDVKIEDKFYNSPTRKPQELPILFQLSGPSKMTQLVNSNLDDPRDNVAYNIKYNVAPLYKHNDQDTLFPEVKVYNRKILIDPLKREVSSGILPYNNFVQRAVRIEKSPYDLSNIDFHFEDMDGSPNLETIIKDEYLIKKDNIFCKPYDKDINENKDGDVSVTNLLNNLNEKFKSPFNSFYCESYNGDINENKNGNISVNTMINDKLSEKFKPVDDFLDMDPENVENPFIMNFLKNGMFKLNVSMCNSKDKLINSVNLDTVMEMYKIINGKKIMIKPETVIF